MMWYVTDNIGGRVALTQIPEVGYGEFYNGVIEKLDRPECHIGNYFAVPDGDELKFYMILLDDSDESVYITSHRYGYYDENGLASLTAVHGQVHPFEREITEKFGVAFEGNPWDKPLRFPFDRFDRESRIENYPFYTIAGDMLHEVNVGPIHAGIIEPGAFRFICNGERVLHLEIALGYQHRGIESLIADTQNRLRRSLLAEAVAGDDAVGHAMAYALVEERLAGAEMPERLHWQRGVALEMERIAMHIADSGALCMDIGYQLGQVACEALRTIVINTMQSWCGNRFGKGLVRPHGSNWPVDRELSELIIKNMREVGRRYKEVREDMKRTGSLLSRFEDCGTVTAEQMQAIGAVGPAARASGLARDIRSTHPWGAYALTQERYAMEEKGFGDVMARLMIRGAEVFRSVELIATFLKRIGDLEWDPVMPDYDAASTPETLAFAFVEGWRGEICHAGLSDAAGRLCYYKIKDPSVHNWLALALAVRGEGISDFPICNKSFNLSYCGHDL